MKIQIIIALLVSFIAQSQSNRFEIKGNLINNDVQLVSGVTIFNTTTLDGTITSDSGLFNMQVALGDKLVFNSVALEDFFVVITETMAKNKSVTINLTERITELETAVINNKSVMVLVKKKSQPNFSITELETEQLDFKEIDRADQTFSGKVRQPYDYPTENKAMQQSQPSFIGNQITLLSTNLSGGKSNSNDLNSDNNPIVREIESRIDRAAVTSLTGVADNQITSLIIFSLKEHINGEKLNELTDLDILKKLEQAAPAYLRK